MEEIKEIIANAKQHMLRDGYHKPMVFAKGTSGKAAVVLEIFGNTAEERAKDMMCVGAMVADRQNVGELELVVLVNKLGWAETWKLCRPKTLSVLRC